MDSIGGVARATRLEARILWMGSLVK